MGVMQARVATTLEDIGLDDPGWNRLIAGSITNSVFQTLPWMKSWWSAFGDQCLPLFVTAFDASGIAGVVPLVIGRSNNRPRVVRFLGDGRADYCDFLTSGGASGALEALFEAVFADRRWDVVELNNVPSTSPTVKSARALSKRAGCRILVEHQFGCPTLMIEGHEAVARDIFNKPSLRRRENYFRRMGRLVCRHLTTMNDIEPYLDRFFGQHIDRWRGSRSPSLFLNARNKKFYRELTVALSEAGWLLFSVVELDDEPIAFHYGFDYAGAVVWYKPSFAVSHAARSPGLVLVRQLIAYTLENKRRELDFTVGDEPFKARFTNARRTTVKVQYLP